MEKIDKIQRTLKERIESLDAEILGGRLQTFEMYQSMTKQRELLISLLDDIKDDTADEDDRTDDGANPGD